MLKTLFVVTLLAALLIPLSGCGSNCRPAKSEEAKSDHPSSEHPK